MSRRLLTVSLLLVALVAALPADALAQRGRGGGGGGRRGPVVVVSPQRTVVYPPGYGPYGPYGPYGWGWPLGYPGRYPYPYYGYNRDDAASLRVETTPRETEVYVDGARAGIVDDYDGIFQRLHLTPGNHEITLYLPGYRSWSETRYFGPRSTSRILHTMLALAPGQTDDPRPVPPPPPPQEMERTQPRQLPGQPADANRPAPRPRAPRPMDPGTPEPAPAPERPRESRDTGTLSVGIKPGDAEITLDGKKQTMASGADRFIIQLPEGVHRLVIQKAGYSTFETDLQVRRGRTLAFDVSLVK